MKRTLPALQLPQTPLVYVVGQVGISPIVHIDKYLPELQEQIRLNGFPRFKRGLVHEIILDAQGPRVLATDRYEFLSKDETLGITVTPNFIAVQTSQYAGFEKFADCLMFALSTVLSVVTTIGLAERIGLRYLDWIRPQGKEDVLAYLKSGLHGLDTNSIGVEYVQRRSEVTGKTEYGRFVAKFYQQIGQLLPPELGPTSLAQPTVQPDFLVSLLDFDHYTERAVDFDPIAIVEIMEGLHDTIDLAFRGAVTEKALQKWSESDVR